MSTPSRKPRAKRPKPKPLPFSKFTRQAWNDAAAQNWTGEMRPNGAHWQALHAKGKCPRCKHEFATTYTEAILLEIGEAKHPLPLGESIEAAQFTILCECDEEHSGRPEGASGCGADWNLVAFWDSQVIDKPVPVVFMPGSTADWQDRKTAEAQRDLPRRELERVREAADKWKTGLSLLLGLIATVSVVKGRSSIETLDVDTQHVIIGLLGSALFGAATAALLSMRAAYGPLSKRSLTGTTVNELRSKEVTTALLCLRWARAVTILTLAALATAVGLAWLSEEPTPAQLSITRKGSDSPRTLCGKLKGVDGVEVRIETQPGVVQTVRVDDVKSATFRQKC